MKKLPLAGMKTPIADARVRGDTLRVLPPRSPPKKGMTPQGASLKPRRLSKIRPESMIIGEATERAPRSPRRVNNLLGQRRRTVGGRSQIEADNLRYSPKRNGKGNVKNTGGLDEYLEKVATLSPSKRLARGNTSPAKYASQLPPHIATQNTTDMVLFDISEDTEFEQRNYILWVQDKLKLYKAMYRKYSTMARRGTKQATFDDIGSKLESMSLQAVMQFLRDFKIGNYEFLKTSEVKQLVLKINQKYERSDYKSLDLECFIEFCLQMGFFMYLDETSKPSEFMPRFLERLRDASVASKQPLFQKFFEDLMFDEMLVNHAASQGAIGDDTNKGLYEHADKKQ